MFASVARPAANPSHHLPQPRLLILDDERFDRHRLQRLCSGLPDVMEVTTADCLAKLSEELEGGQFDLIFVDFNLPDGSGVDALEMIRLCPRNCTAATVMITGLERSEVEDTAQANGCRGFLTKDELSADVFAQTVAQALYKAPAAPEGEVQYDRATVEALLTDAGASFARDMKPLVSRMLRQTRMQRAHPVDGAPKGGRLPPVQSETTLESSCVALWEYLVSLEQKQVHLPDAPPLLADEGAGVKQAEKRKPPSPFSRMN